MRPRVTLAATVLAAALVAGGCAAPRPGAPVTSASPANAASTAPANGAGSASPAPLVGTAPARAFPVGVRHQKLVRDAGRALPTTIWYPAARSGAGTPFAAGRHPVVLFSHGLHGDPSDFTPLLAGWAAAGFVVVAPAYPHTSRTAAEFNIADVLNQPADASFVLTQFLRGSMGAALDPGRVAAAGHSAGAITTIGLFTSARDARLRAGIVLAGSSIGFGDGYAGPPARLLFAHGSADPLVNYAAGQAAFDKAPWPKALLTLPGSGHSDPYLATATPAYRAVSRTTTDFLRFALFGDPEARVRLRSDAGTAASLDDRL